MTRVEALQVAVRYHQAGQLAQAESLYREILAQDPDCADALHHLGLIAHQLGRQEIARELIARAATLAPDNPAIHSNLGEVYRQLRRFEEAGASFRRALALRPDDPSIFNNLGIALTNEGRLEDAARCLQQAVALKPDFAEAHNSLGSVRALQGQSDAAVACFERAIAAKPELAEAHNNLGKVWLQRARLDDAAACFRQALARNPLLPEAHNNLGAVLTEQHRLDEALASFQQALTLRPEFASALNNLGYLRIERGEFDEAFPPLRQALALQPNFAGAHNNLALAFKERSQLDEALASFRGALALEPARADIHSNLIFSLHYRAENEPGAIAAELARWKNQHASPLARLIRPHDNDRSPRRPLRIGFVSPDFWSHPVAWFLLPLFAEHDRAAFAFYCYSDVRREDHTTRQLRSHVAVWREIVGQTDEQVAELIWADRIDVLVDLAQHTARNRLLTFARKPAPVQISYLGSPGGAGLDTIDYRLTDSFADPRETNASTPPESLLRLPDTAWCFAPPAGGPEVGELPAPHRGYPTFGCFNNFAKVTDDIIRLWARILQRVPKSRLTLKNRATGSREVVARLRGLFAQERVSADRLDFVSPTLSHFDHLRCYDDVDIALDTFPYHGTTTTCEALWMGVPVVTLAGKTPAARVGVSLLTNAGFADWVAASPDDYVERAVAVVGDLPRLATLRRGLREHLRRSPLMDAPRFARAVENAFRAAWQRWCENPARVP